VTSTVAGSSSWLTITTGIDESEGGVGNGRAQADSNIPKPVPTIPRSLTPTL